MEETTAPPLPELEGSAVTIALPQSAQSARLARTAVRGAFARWGLTDEDLRHAALLVVSELVTNALRHGGGAEMQLELRLTPGHLRIGVRDTATEALPAARSAEDDEETGRGLAIIDGVSDQWGVEHLGARGKRVWAQLSRTSRR